MDFGNFFDIFKAAKFLEDVATGEYDRKKQEKEEKLASMSPRRRWIEEQLEFQREHPGCDFKYTFIPTDDGDYEVIINY